MYQSTHQEIVFTEPKSYKNKLPGHKYGYNYFLA